MNAVFYYEGRTADYIPESDVSAGSVIQVGNFMGIAQFDILTGETGAVAIEGVWKIDKDANEISAGAKVYWDSSASAATATATGNLFLGYAVSAAAAGDLTVAVKINAGSPITEVSIPYATEAEIKTGTEAAKSITPAALAAGANEDTGYLKIAQAAVIADLGDSATGAEIATAVNAVLAVLRTHGLIATA